MYSNYPTLDANLYAAERTMQAWVRTALNIVGIGIAVTNLIEAQERMEKIVKEVIGLLCILFGMLMFLYGSFKYSKIMKTKLYERKMINDSIAPVGAIFFGLLIAPLSFLLMYM